MKEEFFALGLSEHRLWGYIFLPFALKSAENNKYYNTLQSITPDENDPLYSELPEDQKKIIILIEEYNEQRLFKLFSNHKNLKEFHEKVTRERIDDFIRPYIEKRLAAIFEIVKYTSVRIFIRDKTRTSIFEEDFLQIIRDIAEPFFNFIRIPDASFYSLELKINGTKITLKDQYADIISDHPALIRLNKNIVSIREIEAKKIKPFLIKDHIRIPEQSELKYFKSFVLNIIRRFEVRPQGFKINNPIPEKEAYISLEKDLQSRYVLVLKFRYEKRKILANSSTKIFVDFHNEKGEYQFNKYACDPDFEGIYHNFLKTRGLHSFDEVNYTKKEIRSGNDQGFGIIEWVNQFSNEIKESGLILENNIRETLYFTGQLKLILTTTLDQDWFDIKAVVEAGEFEIPFYRFRKNILAGIREYMLPDTSVLILPEEWFVRYKELFEFAKTEKQILRVHKQHFNIVEDFSSVTNQREVDNLEKLSRREELKIANPPKGLHATLRPYQQEGFAWLLHLQKNRLGGCLADDMGLGKTLQAILILLKNKENHVPSKETHNHAEIQLSLFTEKSTFPASLIVVPASLVHNWINEIQKFAPSLKVYPFFGTQRVKKLSLFDRYDIIISSYHTVRQDIEMLSGYEFNYVILDESQVIKNPGSKIYLAVEQLKGEYKLVLTGTPIENSLTDLWAQMNFANPGLLGNLSFFKKEYVYPIEKKGGKDKEERLKKLIHPYILRRTKSEVAPELPDVSEQVIYCSMTAEQRSFYEKEKSGIRNYIFENIEKEGIEKSSIIVLQGLTRLRQIANHPILVDKDFEYESGKFEEIMRNAENIIAENHKALLFSSFVKHLNLFEREFKKRKLRYEILTGESIKREGIINAFQQHKDCRLFLISLKAGGVGLNLTAADYVFLLDPWWNPASEQQAVSRSHRIGQSNNVFVYRFISENSIEEKIQKLQEKKSKLAEIFVTSNNPVKAMSRKDLEDLLE